MMKEQDTKIRNEVIKKEVGIIKEYIIEFETSAGRNPLLDEIATNMQGKVSDEAIRLHADSVINAHT